MTTLSTKQKAEAKAALAEEAALIAARVPSESTTVVENMSAEDAVTIAQLLYAAGYTAKTAYAAIESQDFKLYVQSTDTLYVKVFMRSVLSSMHDIEKANAFKSHTTFLSL